MTLTSMASANRTARDPRVDYETREFERVDFEAIDFDPWTDEQDQQWEIADDYDDVTADREGNQWEPISPECATLTSHRSATPRRAPAYDE